MRALCSNQMSSGAPASWGGKSLVGGRLGDKQGGRERVHSTGSAGEVEPLLEVGKDLLSRRGKKAHEGGIRDPTTLNSRGKLPSKRGDAERRVKGK